MKQLICNECQRPYYSKSRNYKQKFCSRSCADKQRISCTSFKKGLIPWNKGLKGFNSKYPRNEKWKTNISKGQLKHYDRVGRKSKQNELLRKSQQFFKWRQEVFERDKYTCQKCSLKSQIGQRITLHPHHIKFLSEYPELAFDINNGITLCDKCHQEMHSYIRLSYTGQKAIKLQVKV